MQDFWNETLQIPEARWIFFGAVLLCAVLVAIYFSLKFRNLAFGSGDESELDLLTDFREMRDNGQLDEREYSRLKQSIPGSEQNVATAEAMNGKEDSQSEAKPKKQFMTLAEAESRKQTITEAGANTDSSEAE